jgi:uncharacterized protein
MVIHISQAAALRGEELDELGPVKKPLSEPASRLIGRKYIDESNGIDCMGIWECSPGRWQRTIMQEEFAHFLSGSATFIPDMGEPVEIKAGDTVWFPLNSRGVWEIKETVRKVYVVIDRPGPFRRFRYWMRSLLDPHAAKASAVPVVTAHVGVQVLADTLAEGRFM